jgi:hypothetical protein
MVLASRSRLNAVRVWTNSKGIFHVGWIHSILNIPSTLDMMRPHIESIPEPDSKSQRIFSCLKFCRDSAQLRTELDRVYNGLVSSAHLILISFFQVEKHHPRSSASRHESILETASLSTQARTSEAWGGQVRSDPTRPDRRTGSTSLASRSEWHTDPTCTAQRRYTYRGRSNKGARC